jgi:hypothetical protein
LRGPFFLAKNAQRDEETKHPNFRIRSEHTQVASQKEPISLDEQFPISVAVGRGLKYKERLLRANP